MVKSIRHM